jgi:hypothetical protein
MRTILCVIAIAMIASTTLAGLSCGETKTEPIIVNDQRPCVCDSLRVEMLEDRIGVLGNQLATMHLQYDSVKTKLLAAEFKLERVRYYLKICLRDASQDKFLKGWIKRAVE